MNELKCSSCGGPLGQVSGTAMKCPHCGTALLLPKEGVPPALPALRIIQGFTTISAIIFGGFSILFGVVWVAGTIAIWGAAESMSPGGGLPTILLRIMFAAFLLAGALISFGIPVVLIAAAVKARQFARNAEAEAPKGR